MNFNGPFRSGVRDGQYSLTGRAFKGDVVKVRRASLRVKPASATADRPREVIHRPEVATAGNLLGLRVDGYRAATVEGTDIRLTLLVQRHIPTDDTATPVAEDTGKGLTPVAPIRCIVPRSQVWA